MFSKNFNFRELKVDLLDQLIVRVFPNGSVQIGLTSYIDGSFITIHDVKRGLLGFNLKCKPTNGFLHVGYDLSKISIEEARINSYKIATRVGEKLNMKLRFVKEEKYEFTIPMTGEIRKKSVFYFTIESIDYYRLVDEIMKIKPKEGFLQLVHEDLLITTPIDLTTFYIDMTDEIKTNIHIVFFMPNVFEFKAGKRYVLNIFELFNHSEPFQIHSKIDTLFFIEFIKPYVLDFIFTKIDIPFEYVVSKGYWNDHRTYIIQNRVSVVSRPSSTIDRMIIEFKVVESGFKITPSSIQLIGYSILFSIFMILLFIFHHFKIHRKTKSY